MTFGFTRDSALLWVGAGVALVGYLIGSGADNPPTHWGYGDWLQFASAVGAWALGKLQTSPLPHSEEGDTKIPPSGR